MCLNFVTSLYSTLKFNHATVCPVTISVIDRFMCLNFVISLYSSHKFNHATVCPVPIPVIDRKNSNLYNFV